MQLNINMLIPSSILSLKIFEIFLLFHGQAQRKGCIVSGHIVSVEKDQQFCSHWDLPVGPCEVACGPTAVAVSGPAKIPYQHESSMKTKEQSENLGAEENLEGAEENLWAEKNLRGAEET